MTEDSSGSQNHKFNTLPGCPKDMFWLTNSEAEYDFEPTENLEEVFEKLEIPHGLDEEEFFFPLTNEEKDLVAPDLLRIDVEGDLSLEMGASVLYGNSKYLAHEAFIEFQASDQYEKDWAERINREVGRILMRVADCTNGYLVWCDKPLDDKPSESCVFKPTLLIPFGYAKSVAGRDYKRWREHLGGLLKAASED